MADVEKSRYWEMILYPENMVDNWKDIIEDTLQLPFAYCIHYGELDSNGDDRKVHIHIILVDNHPTTAKSMIALCNKLSNPGLKCCSTAQTIKNVRRAFDYLIHDTNECRKQGKKHFSPDERICGNGFDIGFMEQDDVQEIDRCFRMTMEYIKSNHISNFCDCTQFVFDNSVENRAMLTALKAYSRIYEAECRSQWLKHKSKYANPEDVIPD